MHRFVTSVGVGMIACFFLPFLMFGCGKGNEHEQTVQQAIKTLKKGTEILESIKDDSTLKSESERFFEFAEEWGRITPASAQAMANLPPDSPVVLEERKVHMRYLKELDRVSKLKGGKEFAGLYFDRYLKAQKK